MRLGRVIGNVVSTRKNPKLEGAKLLLVQPLDATATPRGHAVLAVDAVQAGVGDTVLLVIEGRAAGSVTGELLREHWESQRDLLRPRVAEADARYAELLERVRQLDR